MRCAGLPASAGCQMQADTGWNANLGMVGYKPALPGEQSIYASFVYTFASCVYINGSCEYTYATYVLSLCAETGDFASGGEEVVVGCG